MPTPRELLETFMSSTGDADTIRKIVAPKATYVSLNFDDKDLTRIMPWCGTHEGVGPDGIIWVFAAVARFWNIERFEPLHLLGDERRAAAFGRFTYESAILKKRVTTPFAILIEVEGVQIRYMQFMEDTFATAASFQASGNATYHSDPDGQPFTLDGPARLN
jgi:hypothetical protein